mgnify:CR=1 FL=1
MASCFSSIARSHPEVRGVHDLRTRTSGTRDFVQFHAAVDPNMTVARAHEAAFAAEFAGDQEEL